MEIRPEKVQMILGSFLEKWTPDKIADMKLTQYVSVNNKDTFSQWIENRTIELGSIKGIGSRKFGIYRRKTGTKKSKNMLHYGPYSWRKVFGATKQEAFENVTSEILQIIDFAIEGNFSAIDELNLSSMVKWKIAYLYSNERLIPVFSEDIHHKILASYGKPKGSPVSEIQQLLINKKPVHLSIYEYADDLIKKFGKAGSSGGGSKSSSRKGVVRKTAKKGQKRRGSKAYTAEQKHDALQNKLGDELRIKYGSDKVILEENHVDIKVLLDNELLFYEVKSASFASDCIREALGQVLRYVQRDSDLRKKSIIVAGQYEANPDEIEFIEFVKNHLNIDFTYHAIGL